jgi:hypothetical protein
MLATFALLALGLAPDDPPKPAVPPSKQELAAITERGRLLAGYDAAAWHGTDAVLALSPPNGAIQRYIARKTDKGWVVAFGRLDKARDKFLVTYEATETGPERYDAKKVDPPRASTGFELRAALAMDESQTDFLKSNPERRPYNIAAIPAEGGKFWVYFVPAPTRPGVWPLGGDTRYLVSADGAKVLEKRQLHKSIIEVAAPNDKPDARPVAGMHTHVLSDIPEDTDVLHVLSREPRRPEMVITREYVFGVKEDGAIDFVGKVKDVLKK